MRGVLAGSLLVAAFAGCHQFDDELAQCVRSGRCLVDAGRADGGAGDGGADASVDLCPAPTGDALFVRVMDTWVKENGTEESVNEVIARGGTVRVWAETSGVLVQRPVERMGVDQFVARTVPTGDVLVEIVPPDGGPGYRELVLTPQRNLDLGSYRFGRIVGRQYPPPNTSVSFELSGLDAWRSDDSLTYTAINSGITLAPLPLVAADGGSAQPPVGATSTPTALRYEWGLPALDATLDSVTVAQRRLFLTDAGAGCSQNYSAAIRRQKFAVTLDGGADVLVTGSLTDVLDPVPFLANVDVPELFAAASVPAGSRRVGMHVRAVVTPGLPGWGLPTTDPQYRTRFHEVLPQLSDAFRPASQPRNRCRWAMDLRQAYPTAWPLVSLVWTEWERSYPAPDGGVLGALRAYTRRSTVGSASEGFVPLEVTAPLDLKLDDVPLATPASNVRTTPTLTWSPPATGTPSGYTATIYRMTGPGYFNDCGCAEVAARLTTRRTRVLIPPGVLEKDTSYVIQLTAHWAPLGCADKAPLVWPLPTTSADALTELFTTAP